MITQWFLALLPLFFFLFFLGCPLWAQTGGRLSIGYQAPESSTTGSAFWAPQVEKYGELPKGLFVREASFEFYEKGNEIAFKGERAALNNASYNFGWRNLGRLKLTAEFDNQPYLYANEAKSLYSLSGDNYLKINLADASRSWNVYTSTPFASSLTNAPNQTLSSWRQTTRLNFSYSFAKGGGLSIGASRQRKTGDQASAIGFLGAATEIPLPLNQTNDDMYTEFQFTGKLLSASIRYDISAFNNGLEKLLVDNPRSLTRGSISQAPSNLAQNISFASALNLPFWAATLSAQTSFGVFKQNENLLPYSSNRQIANAPFDVTLSSHLPVARMNNKMNTLSQNYSFNIAPIKILGFYANLKKYALEDKRPSVAFPGRAIYDAYWQASPLVKLPENLSTDDVSYGVAFKPFSWVQTKFEKGNNKTSRPAREIPITTESRVKGSTGLALRNNLIFETSHQISQRKADGYTTSPFYLNSGFNNEIYGLRRFDVAQRNRRETQATLSLSESGWETSLNASLKTDDYPPTSQNPYGLLSQATRTLGASLSIPVLESHALSGHYDVDRALSKTRSLDNPINGAWTFVEKQTFVSYGVNATAKFLADRWENTLGFEKQSELGFYDYADLGPGAPQGNGLPPAALATSQIYFQTAFSPASYLRLELGYSWLKYQAYDFARNQVPLIAGSPYPVETFLGASLRPYRTSVLATGVSFLW